MKNLKFNAKLLTSESKPYKVEGNEGVSHKIRLSINDEIFSANASEAQVVAAREFVGKEGEVTLSFSSPKEKLKLEYVSFEPEDLE